MSNPAPDGNERRYHHVPLHNQLISDVRHWWINRNISISAVCAGASIGTYFTIVHWEQMHKMSLFEALSSLTTFVGHVLKVLITNAGALAQPLIEPMIHIVTFAWLSFVLALCFWMWGHCRNKFGR